MWFLKTSIFTPWLDLCTLFAYMNLLYIVTATVSKTQALHSKPTHCCVRVGEGLDDEPRMHDSSSLGIPVYFKSHIIQLVSNAKSNHMQPTV